MNKRFSYSFILIFFFIILILSKSANAQNPRQLFENYEKVEGPNELNILPKGKAYVIRISSTDSLPQLNNQIKKAIYEGEKYIVVEFAQGVYYYNSLLFYLSDIEAPDVCLCIKGNESEMIADGTVYLDYSSIITPKRDYCYLDSGGLEVDLYSDVIQLNNLVEVLDEKNKLCRVFIPERVDFHPNMQIQISEWYRSAYYTILKIDNGFVYFYADDLRYDKSKKCYNVNYDYGVSSLYPRCRFWDPEILEKSSFPVRECSVSSFICFYRVNIKLFELSGFIFSGAAKGENNALFYFRNVKADKVKISNCSFRNIHHRLIQINETDNFVFKNNDLQDCMLEGIYSDMSSDNTIISNNKFYCVSKSWTNKPAVACYGKNFLVANNTFENIGYCSIAAGAHANWTKEKITSGVIECNHIWFNDHFFQNGYKHNLIDGGAIYLATMNERVIVRYNYIHNISGVDANRAVYCDEGAMNVKIYGNIIRDITNGHAILSWRARGVNAIVPESNDGIELYYNIIWGDYKLDEKEGSSCIHGTNLVLYNETKPVNILTNFLYEEDDFYYQKAKVSKNIIVLPRDARRRVKKMPTFYGMKEWLR